QSRRLRPRPADQRQIACRCASLLRTPGLQGEPHRYEARALMILFPAIDLKGGRVVRLTRGEMASATVYNDDPVAQAQAFEAQGFEWLHLVDLDGAVEGRAVNAEAVTKILFASSLPVQLGGGIRDRAAITEWLEAGVRRVILGTIAVRDPALVKE